MGKRLLLITFFIIVLSMFVSASLSVTLDSTTVSGRNVTLVCTVNAAVPDSLTKVDLFTNTIGTWHANKTTTSVVGKTTDTVSFTVYNIPNGNYNWNCRAYNSTSSKAAAANGTYTISVTANTAPLFTGTILTQTFAEDASLSNAFDLDDYFSDTDALTYTSSGASNVQVSISSGAVTLTAAANWSGTETITFIATDTGSLINTSNSVLINVTPVNDAPYYSTIPNLNWTKNTDKTINLNDYFHDVEGSTLTYNVTSVPNNISISFSGSSVTLSSDNNWLGTRTITFIANDSQLTTSSNAVELSVIISGNNTAPTIICFGTGFAKIDTGESQKLSITTSDSQGDTVTIKWYVDNDEVNGETGQSYLFSKDTEGVYIVKAEASDGSETASCLWTVNVTATSESEESGLSAKDVESLFDDQTQVTECGNNIPEKNENCSNCPQDISCGENEVCSEGVCILEKPNNTVAIIIFFIITLLIAIGGFVIFKMTSKKSERHMFNEAVNLDKEGGMEKPSIDVHDIYHREKSQSKEPSIPKRPTAIKETPLQKYIKTMKVKGFQTKEIAEKLKKQGWKDEDFKGFL
ncbi:MAG: hypothetical protein KKA65_04660 [Nanoarchaeota archaeon]|nr:hypothetical protein [Nanoarchaeota archaeon]MBU4456767.1 hypothetical protein [Nanoarchaeota archaeon]MCG2719658.1 Ig-like domain-containing protein [Nanoarchaeota archaeon]